MTRDTPGAASWRGLVAPGLVTLLSLCILVALGTWQLERKAWKEDILARLDTRTRSEPGEIAPEAGWPAWRADADEFRRVRVEGTFLHDREALVHGLRPEGLGSAVQGFYVFTPLQRPDGEIVMINRGFVPTDLKNPELRREGQVAGPVTVTGLLRAPESRTMFVPTNDAAAGRWFVRDPGEMARARGLGRAAPFYVEADATPNPGGWPKGGRSSVSLPNNHLQYALTWYGLAFSLAGVFAAFAWRRLRPGEVTVMRPDLEAKTG